jgi:hypothetical protein
MLTELQAENRALHITADILDGADIFDPVPYSTFSTAPGYGGERIGKMVIWHGRTFYLSPMPGDGPRPVI